MIFTLNTVCWNTTTWLCNAPEIFGLSPHHMEMHPKPSQYCRGDAQKMPKCTCVASHSALHAGPFFLIAFLAAAKIMRCWAGWLISFTLTAIRNGLWEICSNIIGNWWTAQSTRTCLDTLCWALSNPCWDVWLHLSLRKITRFFHIDLRFYNFILCGVVFFFISLAWYCDIICIFTVYIFLFTTMMVR